MSEPPSEFHISPEDAGEINKASAEAEAFNFELKKEAQAQGWLGQFWGGKDNASTNIVGLIIILLILFLFVAFVLVEDQRLATIGIIKALLFAALGYFLSETGKRK